MTANDNDQGALARLAAYCGIAAEYGDVWGKPHATSENTLRALLTAMHFPPTPTLRHCCRRCSKTNGGGHCRRCRW